MYEFIILFTEYSSILLYVDKNNGKFVINKI